MLLAKIVRPRKNGASSVQQAVTADSQSKEDTSQSTSANDDKTTPAIKNADEKPPLKAILPRSVLPLALGGNRSISVPAEQSRSPVSHTKRRRSVTVMEVLTPNNDSASQKEETEDPALQASVQQSAQDSTMTPESESSELRVVNEARVDDELNRTAMVIRNLPYFIRERELEYIMERMRLPVPHTVICGELQNGYLLPMAFAHFRRAEETATAIKALNGLNVVTHQLGAEYMKYTMKKKKQKKQKKPKIPARR